LLPFLSLWPYNITFRPNIKANINSSDLGELKREKKSFFQFFLLANSIPENISKNLRIFALQRKGKNTKNLNENEKKLIRRICS